MKKLLHQNLQLNLIFSGSHNTNRSYLFIFRNHLAKHPWQSIQWWLNTISLYFYSLSRLTACLSSLQNKHNPSVLLVITSKDLACNHLDQIILKIKWKNKGLDNAIVHLPWLSYQVAFCYSTNKNKGPSGFQLQLLHAIIYRTWQTM